MVKNNSIKRSLVASILILCLCFASFIGTTFAWFSDSVTSANNIIKSGTLDVQLLMHNGTEYVDISESEKPIFGENSLISDWEDVDFLWEPGKTQIVYLGVKNAGNLAFKYNVLVDVEDKGLVGALDYAIIDGLAKDDADALSGASWSDILAVEAVQSDLIKSGRTVAAENGALDSDSYDYFALAVHMKEEAGNEYKDKSIVVDISIMAIQLSNESDSFGDDYDAGLNPITTYMFSGADINNSTTKSGFFALSGNIKTSESNDRYGFGYEYIFRKGADYTLDMNGKTVVHDTVNDNGNGNALTYLFVANNPGTKLTINGDGKVYSGNSAGYACAVQGKDGTLITINGGDFEVDNGIAVWAGTGSRIVINGGSFVNCNATTDHELIYTSGGAIDIYGGFFHNTDGNYTLNVEDRNRATSSITVYGGTYVNFDPSTGGQDPGQIKVAEGYMVTSEAQANGDVWYTVVPVPEGYTVASTANEVTDALEAGQNIVLAKDIEFTEALTIDGDIAIDLNGKKISTVGLTFTGNVSIKNGTVASGGNTDLVPHLKVLSGNLTMTDVTVDVNHHLNANVYWAEATAMEVQNATAVLNNCNIKVDNQTGAQWVYSYGISLNNADLTVNGGSITASCIDGTAANGPTNPNAISAMGECAVTLIDVAVTARYYATTVNGHLTINTTDKNITSENVVDNRGGSHTLKYIN